MEHISEALKLLVVGMTTVFAILLIVIYLGKALVALVNRFAPAEEAKKAVAAVKSTIPAVDEKTRNIINAAVAQITGGKGKVNKITKI